MRRLALIAMGGLLGIAPSLSAQTLTGRVVLRDSTTPVAGAIVVATDASGGQKRTLTSASGHFLLRVVGAGPYTTQLLRIGFQPTAGPAVTFTGTETRALTLIAQSLPVSLTTVTVTGASSCRVRADTGLAVARIWEEARKAMLASTLRGDETGLTGTWMVYERTTDSTGRIVRDQLVRVEQRPTQRVFQSLPVDSLSRVGYVVQDKGGLSYYAPDPDVLLSSAFADDHCFRLTEPPPDSATLLGIAFTPARRERGRYDIAGTAWVDRPSGELRAVDFAFADLPGRSTTSSGGGRVEFVRLPSGEWFISSWWARLPVFAPADRPGAPGTRGTRVGPVPAALRSVHQTGGEVSQVSRGDAVLYARDLPAAHLQLVSTDAAIPAAGATITLGGTNLAGTSDTRGTVRLGPVPAGQYAAVVTHPALDSIDAPPLERTVVARRGGTSDTLALPSLSAIVRNVCPSVDSAAGSALLRGTVRDSLGAPMAGAALTVRYLRVDARSIATSSAVRWNEETRRATTDARGRWRLCGMPRSTDLAIEATNARRDAQSRQRVRIDPLRMFAVVELVLRTDTITGGVVADGFRTPLRVVVVTADSIPVPEVTLDVTEGRNGRRDARTRTVVTDLLGSAAIPDVMPGPVTIASRRIGFQAGTLAFEVSDSVNDVRIVLSPIAAPRLDTLRVTARRVPDRFDAFEARRLSRAATATITRADIDRQRPVQTWQLLSRVTSVRITASALGVYAGSSRGDKPSLMESGKACPMQIIMDGVRLSPADGSEVDLNQLPPPEAIHGIEVFAGAARLPLEFGGAGANKWCGVIAIWTR
jgi:hypothetical protein